MKKLKKEMQKKGMKFFQVYENETFYIYATIIEDWFNSYEIFTKKLNKPWKYCEEESERYPRDDDFGVWAWSCSNDTSLSKILRQKYDTTTKEIEEIISQVGSETQKILNLVSGTDLKSLQM
jgi:hypothetical protein